MAGRLRAGRAAGGGASTDGLPSTVGGRRRRGLAAAVAVAAAAAAGWLLVAGGSEDEGGATRVSGATATVVRQTLVEREDVDGTLGYAGKRTLLHRSESSAGSDGGAASGSGAGAASGSGAGAEPGSPTLTAVARAGSVVRRGGVLYRANGEPVVLMYGATPAYRSLGSGADGRDVLQLERNLAKLGFGSGSLAVDGEFTAATAAAVRDWQEALGVEETGTVELGRVAFMPGERRIGAAKAAVGSLLSEGSEVVETTSTRRVVAIELEASQQSLARRGARVSVTLPDGRDVNGRISSVGRVAREPESDASSGEPGADTGGEAVIDVTVTLRRARGTGRLDEAPVTVGLAQETRRDVLTVPVAALLAREGGGYAVEVVRGGSSRTVPVRTGLFASGLVEVSGSSLEEGARVRVPE